MGVTVRSYYVPSKRSDVAVVCGEASLDGGNPTPISVAPLGVVLGVVFTLKASAAPGLNASALTYDNPAGSTVNVYGWKPTSVADPTLVASAGAEPFSFVAFGY